MRKIISLLLAIAMVMSMATVAFAAEATFTDLEEGQYYVPAVEWAVAKGVTTGVSATEFAPHATCTRGQVVTFLYRAAGEPEIAEGTKNPFTDVAEGAYYYNAVLWAVAEGVTTGATETTFNPDGECKREHVVTFQYRAAGEPVPAAAAEFTDVAEDAYYADAVAWAVEEGITTGATETTFNPAGACERAHVVTFLYRSYLPGAVNSPILVTELSSIEVEAGKKAYYSIHGRLSGQFLTIVADEDEDVTVTVGGKAVEGVDGVYTAELTGAPVTSVVITNNGEEDASLVVEINYASGTESNPIVVNLAEDMLSVAAAAEGETYYQISSDLNGMFLNIAEVEGVTVTLNDEELVANEEGVITAELTGTPSNKLVVANSTGAAIETPAVIESAKGSETNPIQINSAEDMSAVSVAAGEKVYYAINSRLNGQGLFLNVQAVEGLTVSINGVKAEANDDGYYVVSLDIESAVIQVIVTNNSEETVEAIAYIKTAPGTESNPIIVDPSMPNMGIIPAGETMYYTGRVAGMTMMVNWASNLVVNYDGKDYTPSAGPMGGIEVAFAASDSVPVPFYTFTITNNGEYEASPYAQFVAIGSFMMPEELTSIETINASVAEGNNEGYYYSWTATEAGTLTVSAADYVAGEYDVDLAADSSYSYPYMSENDETDTEGTVSIAVAAGDVVKIHVISIPEVDENYNYIYNAVEVVLNGSFVPAEAAE